MKKQSQTLPLGCRRNWTDSWGGGLEAGSGDCYTAQGGIDSNISESMADLKEPSSNFWGQGPLSQRQVKAGHLLRGLEGRGGWAGDARSLGEAREGKRS